MRVVMHLRTGEAVVRVFRNKGLLRHHPVLKSEAACAKLGACECRINGVSYCWCCCRCCFV